MRRRARRIGPLLPLCIAIAGAGCGKKSEPAPANSAPAVAAPAQASQAAPTPAPPLFDAEGRLLPGDERFLGFAIPRGFHRTTTVGGLFVYESSTVPIGKLRAYVAARVITDEIVDVGTTSYTFRNAGVRDGERTDHRLDLFVASIGSGVQLRIQDIPPPAIPAGSTSADRERVVDEAWQRQE